MTETLNSIPEDVLNYQALLDRERNPVPEALRSTAPVELGSQPLPTEPYLSREYHELEMRKLWPCTWQATCRETEVAATGDFCVHDIGDSSILLVRTESGDIQAYLSDSRREFLHIDTDALNLPRVSVSTWGGWVFINIDGKAAPLREYLGVMTQHFERWSHEKSYKALHIKKVLRCNWKVAHEAFIESFHTVATHPQLLLYTGDVNSQYDCFDQHISRSITPMGLASPHLADATELDCVNQWLSVHGVEAPEDLSAMPDSRTAREYLGELNIRRFSEMFGQDLSDLATHSEVLDAILYSVFPNFAPWAGFRPNLTYRFLPFGDDHQMCSMEIMLLMRYPESQERPRDVPALLVGPDDLLKDVEGISPGFARVFDQDFCNLPQVQKGLRNLQSGEIQLGNYQEVRIRHFRNTLDKYLNTQDE
jgi:phenylpropionate dioxygenase-like ring-hydroxylating dioxygenase large terminal subunit